MVTKGVASMPSPVCNLRNFDTSITHEAFADVVAREFRAEYGISACVSHFLAILAASGDEI
jgi:lipoate-protein ligase A